MITEAQVGVGIKGVEGQQAARSADFAIGEFKLLKRLMFWHGREFYRKNCNLVLYSFYKNVLLNMPNVFFGLFSYWSGSRLYDEVGYQLFNLAFTSIPIVYYALFDKSTSDVVLMKDPRYYGIGPKRIMLNDFRFFVWISWATLQAFLIYIFAYPSMISFQLFDYKFSTDHGKRYGLYMMGEGIFVTIIVLCNLKLLSFSNSYSYLYVFFLVLSAALGYLTWLVLHTFDLGDLEHTFTRLTPSLHYLLFCAFVLGLFMFDYGFTKVWGKLGPYIRLHCIQKILPPSNPARVPGGGAAERGQW